LLTIDLTIIFSIPIFCCKGWIQNSW